jgi:DNA replication protein DnaC
MGTGGQAFYRVLDAAYERRSVALTTNLHPSRFDTIMPTTVAAATVDRLLHHAHVVLTATLLYASSRPPPDDVSCP